MTDESEPLTDDTALDDLDGSADLDNAESTDLAGEPMKMDGVDPVNGSDTVSGTEMYPGGTSESSESSDPLADEIDSEIFQLATERDQFKDIAQRLQADFENYRKRASTQLTAETDRARGRLAEALLPVLDAFDAAYTQHPDVIEPLFNLTLAELRKQGLEVMNLVDQRFDPNLADAVAHEPGEGGDVVVADVLRTGYTWNGRTLRPAMVRTTD